MYKGFCIEKTTIKGVLLEYLSSDARKERYKEVLQSLDTKESDVTTRIADILKGDAKGIIDGEALQNACMPTAKDKYHIFISHSHTEKDEARGLAAYLYMEYGLNCFVDGFVWGSCDKDILRPLDDIWSTHDTKKGSYSYEKRNYSTSLVHALLSMALLEMIDNCECCIFIKPTTDFLVSGIENYTTSPWIYEEIMMFNKVDKPDLQRVRRINESFSDTPRLPKIRYKLDLSNMPELEKKNLQAYISEDVSVAGYSKAYRWLDYVYDSVKKK